MVYCRRCNRILKSPKATEVGIGPVCVRKEAAEAEQKHNGHEDNSLPFSGDIIFRRDGAKLITNVPRNIIFHSPDGYEWGYAGSGPADFALNILAQFINVKTAEVLHQEFKRDFIGGASYEGGTIKGDDITAWLRNHGVTA